MGGGQEQTFHLVSPGRLERGGDEDTAELGLAF